MKICSGVKCALTTALFTTLVLATSEASANGRYPRGQQLIEFPSNPNRLVLAATYGLVSTDDGGKNWYYICETAFTYVPPAGPTSQGYAGDPLLALTADESILAGVQERVTKSSDAACGWTKSLEIPGTFVEDIAVAPSNRNIAFALVKTGTMTQVHETVDGGMTWSPIGTPLNVVIAYTIDVDPKDPTHLMVTGITDYRADADTGVFLNSTNRGMTWSVSPIPKTNVDAGPYIAGVHPTNPDVVFVRTDQWVPNDNGGTDARDALLYTKDGGRTWTELLRPIGQEGAGAKLFGFAISPDGATVLAGYGDPVDSGGRTVDRSMMGVYKSSGPDYSFGPTPMPSFVDSVSCLTWTAKGVYLCGSPDGGAQLAYIGFASDPNNLTTTGITKIMQAGNLSGKPACCAGRAVTTCDWSSDCSRFLACGDGGTPPPPGPDAAVCMMPTDAGRDVDASRDANVDQSTGGAAGMAGASGAAGSAGSGGTTAGRAGGAGTGGAGGAGTGGAATGGSGGAATGGASGAGTGGTGGSDCSCRVASTSRERSVGAVSGLLALAGACGWRRSRRRRENAV
jgi:hypothetical protein